MTQVGAHRTVSRDHRPRAGQEESLREALRVHPADRRGYSEVQPEAAGDRGSSRLRETVVAEVPPD